MVLQEIVVKAAISFFFWIKIFENTAFGHVTEFPTCITERWSRIRIQKIRKLRRSLMTYSRVHENICGFAWALEWNKDVGGELSYFPQVFVFQLLSELVTSFFQKCFNTWLWVLKDTDDKASIHKNLHHLYALQMFNTSLWTSSPLVLLVSRALCVTDTAKVLSILLKTPGSLFSNNLKIISWL